MRKEVMILKASMVKANLAACAQAMHALKCEQVNLCLQVDENYKVQAFVIEDPRTGKFVSLKTEAFRLQVDFAKVNDDAD